MSKQAQKQRSQPTNGRKRAAPKYKAGKRVRANGSSRGFWVVAAVVVVIGVAAVVAVESGRKATTSEQPASAALVKAVTSVPKRVFSAVGPGTASPAPKAVSAPALLKDGKPEVLYMGAEYCPYCATERWPMVLALSRFGTFSGLKVTHSSSTDVFANTQTFSFHGATYQSQWLSFTGVEMQSNQRQGDGYAPLDTPTSEQQKTLDTYDRAPYVGTDASSSGGIPFVDFGGKFLVGGATYDPSLLQGKSATDIAAALSDPTSTITQGAVGAANTFTAAICTLTHGQPSSVCADPTITKLQSSL